MFFSKEKFIINKFPLYFFKCKFMNGVHGKMACFIEFNRCYGGFHRTPAKFTVS